MSQRSNRYSQRAAFHGQGVSSSNDVNQSQNSEYYKRNATQDDVRMNRLQNSVSRLTEISINMGEVIRDQNQFLQGMEGDMDNAQNALVNTMRNFYRMAATQNGNYVIYMCLFILFVFLFLYSGLYRFIP